MRLKAREDARIAGILVPVAYAALLAGQNLPNPLMPVYNRELHIGAIGIAAIFDTYLVVLVGVLAAMAHPRLQRRPRAVLVAALALSIAADGALVTETLAGIVIGRVVTGFAVGLGTGAAATLMVALTGERGRTVAATGNALGAVTGTLAAALSADLIGVTRVGYIAHAAVTAVLMVSVLVVVHAPLAAVTSDLVLGTPHSATSERRHVLAGFLCGAAAWSAGSVVVVFVPLLVLTGASGSVFMASCGVLVLLGAAAIGQFVLFRGGVIRPAAMALLMLGCGLVLLAFSAAAWLPLLLVGCALTGLGQGVGYRAGMKLATKGLPPTRQGARASLYACTSYGAAALVVFAAGIAVSEEGPAAGLALCSIGLALVIAAIATSLPRTASRPVAEEGRQAR